MELKDINKNIVKRISEAPTNLSTKEFAEHVVLVLKEEVGSENLTEFATKLFQETYQTKTLDWTKNTAEIIKNVAALTEQWRELGKLNNTYYATTAQEMLKAEAIPGLVDSINYEASDRKVISLREGAKEGHITILSDTLKKPIQKDGKFELNSGWTGFLTYVIAVQGDLSFRVIGASELTPLTIREDVVFSLPVELLILGYNSMENGFNFRRAAAIYDEEHMDKVEDILTTVDKLEEVDLGFNNEEKREQFNKIKRSYEGLGYEVRAVNIVDTLRAVKAIDSDAISNIEVSEVTMMLVNEDVQVVGAELPFTEVKFVQFSIFKAEDAEEAVFGAIEVDKQMRFSPVEYKTVEKHLEDLANKNYKSMVEKLATK